MFKRLAFLIAAIVWPMLPLTWSLAMYFGSKQTFCPPNYEALTSCLAVGYFGPPFACGAVAIVVVLIEIAFIRGALKNN